MRLSQPMRSVLRNLWRGLPASNHCHGQSDYGGLESTVRALVKRGLMNWEYQLTEAGLDEALALYAKVER